MAHAVSVFDLVSSLSEAIDLVSPRVASHNLHTAWIAHAIAREMQLPEPWVTQLVLAACLHDVGGLSLQERLDALDFDAEDNRHGETGAALLSQFAPFRPLARIIREHHAPWESLSETEAIEREPDLTEGERLLRGILLLADRVDVCIKPGMSLSAQVPGIVRKIGEAEAGRFNPDALDAFLTVANRATWWEAIKDGTCHERLSKGTTCETIAINGSDMTHMFSLFGRIVDFRSPYTASHSAAVAACAARLGGKFGFDADGIRMLELAGYLHDIGKLAVPKELLEKHAPLTKGEYRIIRDHPFQSGNVLRHLKAFTQLRIWVSQHHERMNGKGYPCHVQGESLSLGSRILAVADVFVALTENRPYRTGMNLDLAGQAMDTMRIERSLDPDVLATLAASREEMDEVRVDAQKQERGEYHQFTRNLHPQ